MLNLWTKWSKKKTEGTVGIAEVVAEVAAEVEVAVAKPKEVFTLPEVVDHYVSTNEDTLDNDFTVIDARIQTNEKTIDFLQTEEYKAFDNERGIYRDKREEIQEKNWRLESKKTEITRQIKANETGYQKIDLSFLSMKRPSKGYLPYMPAFSVHRYRSKSFGDCSFQIHDYKIEITNNNFVTSKTIMRHLLKPFVGDIKMNSFKITYGEELHYKLDKELGKNWRTRQFSTSFKGLIPETTKRKIKDAEELFSGDQSRGIFLIKECPNWQEQEITEDPLIVGIIGDQAYLIDQFDCTNLEAYIKAEFTE